MAVYAPDRYQHILGKTFVTQAERPVLVFNTKPYDRYELGRIGIPSMAAGKLLSLVLQRLSITDPTELARRVHEIPTLKGVGLAAMSSAIALLNAHGDQLSKAAVSTWNAEVTRVPRRGSDERIPVTFATAKRRKTKKKGKK